MGGCHGCQLSVSEQHPLHGRVGPPHHAEPAHLQRVGEDGWQIDPWRQLTHICQGRVEDQVSCVNKTVDYDVREPALAASVEDAEQEMPEVADQGARVTSSLPVQRPGAFS